MDALSNIQAPSALSKMGFHKAPLSPLLFNIYTAQALSRSGENVAAYADDLAVWVTASSLSSAQQKLTQLLAPVYDWATNHRMVFSGKKCKVLTITRKRNVDDPVVPFGPTNLVAVSEAKYLGVILDRALTFQPHVNSLVKRTAFALNTIRKHSHTIRGCHQTVAIRMYTTILRPVIEYGSIIWGDASGTTLNKLDSIQHQALTRALAVNSKSHRSDVCVESNTAPLEVRRQIELLRYWRTIHKHTRPITHLLDNFPQPDALTQNRRKSFLVRLQRLLQVLHISPADAAKLTKADLHWHRDTLWHNSWRRTRLRENDDRYKAYNLLHQSIHFTLPRHYNTTPRATLAVWHMLRLSSAPLCDFLSFIRCSPTKFCSCNRQAETVDHFLLHCRKYKALREQMLQNIKQYFEGDCQRVTSAALLGNPYLLCDESTDAIFLAVTQFIHDTKRFDC